MRGGFDRVAEGRRVLFVGGGGSPGYMRFAMRGLVDAVREGGGLKREWNGRRLGVWGMSCLRIRGGMEGLNWVLRP